MQDEYPAHRAQLLWVPALMVATVEAWKMQPKIIQYYLASTWFNYINYIIWTTGEMEHF